jgi:membrane protein YdbS with pleckstrin-like domain
MVRLGDGHFATVVEQIPGEQVVWEGGADRRGRWIPYARVGFIGLLFLAVIVWFFGLLFLLPTPSNPPRGRLTTEVKDQSRSVNAQVARESVPRSWSPLLMLLGSGLLMLAISIVVEAKLSNRNAWYVVTNERICVQSGVLGRYLTILDIDKVLSVRVSASWLERRLGLQSIEFLHAGNRITTSGRMMARDQVVMAFVPAHDRLVTDLVNSWLPRDNARLR